MRLLQYLIILVISIGSLLFIHSFYQVTYAASCMSTSEWDASEFLANCATVNGASDGAIDPQFGDAANSIKILVSSIAVKVISFGALFAIGALVWSWIQYNLSSGDDEKVKKAKTTWIYSLIGLLILLVAFPMVNIVVEFVFKLANGGL